MKNTIALTMKEQNRVEIIQRVFRGKLSRQRGTTVSELVRESVREKYMSKKEVDKVSLARQLGGIWRSRKGSKEIDQTVRRLRKGKRLKRLGLG